MKKTQHKKVVKVNKQQNPKKQIQAKKTRAFKAKNLGSLKMFLTSETKKAFIKLKQAFIKALIHNHYNQKHHIYNELDIFGYAISRIFN